MPRIHWFAASLALIIVSALAACATRPTTVMTRTPQRAIRVADTAPATFKAQVAPLLASRCMGCHTPGGRGSRAVEIFDDAGQVAHANVAARIVPIVKAVESGRMPPRGPKFTEAELTVLRSWRDAGARND
ncbi:MAG: hypothetical protein VKP62_06215 [Candidatus Sericytochromatia bacterium]|nr:hypothetical protein [Candidatus Sericytochromatia bacterium]